jgi:glycosyltransferase involved in cell wall biosynthesis
MRRSVEKEIRSVHVEVIPSGIDLGEFRPMDRMAAREKLGISGDGSPWILFSSLNSGNPVKRTALAKAAVEIVRKERPEAKLKIATGVSHSDMPCLINACNVLLVTSVYEGWPNIVKEALACNVPFVSTDVSDLRSIAEIEQSCHISDPIPDALARCLTSSLLSERSATLRHHVESMDVAKTAQRLVSLYEFVDLKQRRC